MDTKEILRRNPAVDVEQAESYLKYVQELQRAGFNVQPRFRLDLPLQQIPPRTISQQLKRR